MDDFTGDPGLKSKFTSYVSDLQKSYRDCHNLLLTGTHGIGKTMMVTGILKHVAASKYSGLYVTMNDLVNYLVAASETAAARKQLITVDFLVVDEFDPRHIGSQAQSDLFGRVFEDIFRTRVQNSMPTILCSNSPDAISGFKGAIKTSLESLMNYVDKYFSLLNKDMRKDKK